MRLCVIPLAVLALFIPAARLFGQDPPSSPAAEGVARDTVSGSIHHGRGMRWQRFTGRARVIDATTLELADGTRIDLGLITPAPDQMALNGDKLYPCGREAAEFLGKLIGDRPVICFSPAGREDYTWWKVYVGEVNLERAMVINGWALADHSTLHADEIIARENKRGLWRGQFILPGDWRAGLRLPGEPPPPRLSSQREAQELINEYGEKEEVATMLLARIVKDLPQIRRLDLPGGTTDESFAGLTPLASLEELHLGGGVTDAALVHLKAFPRLRRLGLTSTIGDGGLVHLRTLAGLTHLNLAWSPHTDAGLENLKELTALEFLNLGYAEITDAGLAHLAGMQRLRRLTLHNTKITDEGLRTLGKLKGLVVLDIHQTRITSPGLAHLATLDSLAYLDISGNGMTDTAVEPLLKLKTLRVLRTDGLSDEARQRLKQANPELSFDGTPESAGYQL